MELRLEYSLGRKRGLCPLDAGIPDGRRSQVKGQRFEGETATPDDVSVLHLLELWC